MAVASNTIRGVPNSIHHCEVLGENLLATGSAVVMRSTDARKVARSHIGTAEAALVETVPDGVDVLEATFVAAVAAANCVAVPIAPSAHATIVSGNVISHYPLAGASVLAGTVVKYVLSTGA